VEPLVAIPVYNEERHLCRVLEAVRRYTRRILVVDDGSTDGTARILRQQRDLFVIRHCENRGYGQSLISALSFASRQGYSWVLTLDCDEQHEPGQIPDFVEEILRDRADVISGSRYLRSFPDDDPAPPERRQVNRTITAILRRLLGLSLTDSFCGFKAYRVSAVRRLALDEPGYAFPLQFWVQAARARLRVREIPVHRIYRDKSRRFGGTLDDPVARLRHYLEVLARELRRDFPPSAAGDAVTQRMPAARVARRC